ncbi:serine protease [Actinosynnema sp. NPDC002837]
MITGEGRAGPFPHGTEEWRVRLRCRGRRGVVGAGVLLDSEHVLTCAHVALAAEDLTVELVGLPEMPVSAAHIVEHVEPQHERGDVALLRLATPQPGVRPATLHKVAMTWNRSVHAQGYPGGLEEVGAWATMTLSGMAGAEWQQMNSNGGHRVQRGFSGAGVADDASGHVLGIVVSEYNAEGAGLSWMIPVAAVEAHLPVLSRWVLGDDGIDERFKKRAAHYNGRVRELMDWLSRRQDGGAVLIIVGEDLEHLQDAVSFSAVGESPAPDLAINVEGLTTEEVSRRVLDRAGLVSRGSSTERVREGTPPMTVVIDGVDAARDPRSLLQDIGGPMVASGARLVLGFRDGDAADVVAARELARAAVVTRLDGLVERVTALMREDPDTAATKLRLGLSALRRAAAADWRLVEGKLPRFDRAITRAERERAALRRVRAEVSVLRGRLASAQARAAAAGFAEDLDLDRHRRRAHAALEAEPLDLAVALRAVQACEEAVRRRLGRGDQA